MSIPTPKHAALYLPCDGEQFPPSPACHPHHPSGDAQPPPSPSTPLPLQTCFVSWCLCTLSVRPMVCGSKAPHRLQHAAAAAGEVGATARTRKGVDQRDGANRKMAPKNCACSSSVRLAGMPQTEGLQHESAAVGEEPARAAAHVAKQALAGQGREELLRLRESLPVKLVEVLHDSPCLLRLPHHSRTQTQCS